MPSTACALRKAYLLAVLMLAPLLAALRRYRDHATGALAGGLTAGLFFTSIAILIERLAFPGLLNFSSDYRVTALFWEMHVGGAALDGFLALSLPFTIMAILSARSPARWLLAGGLILLAVYACLVTFSRGVYLSVPVSLMLLAILLARRGESWSLEHAARMLGKVCLAALFMSAMSYLTFRYGGYRALLAVLAVFAISLPLGGAGRDLPMSGWAPALGAGVLVGAAVRCPRVVDTEGRLCSIRTSVCLYRAGSFAPAPREQFVSRHSRARRVLLAEHHSRGSRPELGWVSGIAGHRDCVGGLDGTDDLECARPVNAMAA